MVYFELEAFPEPKALVKADLERLLKEETTIAEVSQRSGLSLSAVQERLKPRRKWSPEKRAYVNL